MEGKASILSKINVCWNSRSPTDKLCDLEQIT